MEHPPAPAPGGPPGTAHRHDTTPAGNARAADPAYQRHHLPTGTPGTPQPDATRSAQQPAGTGSLLPGGAPIDLEATRAPADERELVATLLDRLATLHSDSRYSRAAGAIRGKHAGRRAHSDGAALQQMRGLLASGNAASVEQAARFVARTVPGHSEAATTARLATKYRRGN